MVHPLWWIIWIALQPSSRKTTRSVWPYTVSVTQACRVIPDMQSLTGIISAIYNFVSQSSKRTEQLKELNNLLEQKNIKLKKLFDVCWRSMGEAIVKNYESLLILTNQEAANGDPVATGLSKQLSSYLFRAIDALFCGRAKCHKSSF